MFIYSVRASTLKFFLVIALTLSVLFGILFIGDGGSAVVTASDGIDFSGIKTNEDRLKFIEEFGVSVENEPTETVEFKIPSDFDRVITEYNQIQRRQGLDLTKYKGKTATRYTYKVTNHAENGAEALVNLIIFKDKVIACDKSISGGEGIVSPLVKVEGK